MSRKIEPREHIIDNALASGNREVWKQALNFSDHYNFPPCIRCTAMIEPWWNYCAMCGCHLRETIGE